MIILGARNQYPGLQGWPSRFADKACQQGSGSHGERGQGAGPELDGCTDYSCFQLAWIGTFGQKLHEFKRCSCEVRQSIRLERRSCNATADAMLLVACAPSQLRSTFKEAVFQLPLFCRCRNTTSICFHFASDPSLSLGNLTPPPKLSQLPGRNRW